METKNITLQKYPAYKDSGIEWLGEIPEHWQIHPGLKFITENKSKNTGMIRNSVLSLSYGKIRVKQDDELTGLVPESFETYQLINKGDLIFRPTDLQNDKVSLRSAYSEYDGIITNAYLKLQFKQIADSKFFHYFFRAIDNNKIIYGLGSGLRQNISYLDFRRFLFPFPPLSEQTAIAAFLDDKTAKIDRAIAQKEKLITLLKERKQIIIQDLVTGKKVWNAKKNAWTEPAKVKDSGVEWIGDIPEEWEVKRLRYVSKINTNSLPENTPKSFSFNYVDIGSISFENGIERTENFEFKNAPCRARRIAKNGNTVISTVRTYLKAIDYISEHKADFIFSTGFAVLEPIGILDKFLYHFVRSNAFTEQVTLDSKGMSYPAINSTDLSRLFLTIPPIQEQTDIVAHIEAQSAKIDKAIGLQEQQIEKLKELKACMIDRAVTGKIKVN